ncbi:monooxygenase [Gloeophyllum trabeum ATCC 11539]|uniref:Monooxygenase n=1 Tax=Gloeophyllum trabeum (strain ATCC 11539 / FP-39264 / Madison 617) TaxID=670483 RepID=S7S5H2_GLOTA|nr:monooxygenase [Gloeophyllum trabeum ATCC 11539]EPQ61229.1 monooxygenase [Gloeophyllum trabeum ATCC 11539]
MSPAPPEVLIVGAGPAGLVAALTLAHNDIPVRIIEKLPSPRLGQKGAGIQPRSLEVYRFLDVLPDLLWEGTLYPPMRLYKLPGGTEVLREWYMVDPTEPKPGVPYLNGLLLGQDHLEATLRKHLERRGYHVEFGTELVSLEQDADRVVARLVKKENGQDVHETIETKFLIGADGAKGIVRKQLGLKFQGETRDGQHMIIADVHIEGLDNDHWHMWRKDNEAQLLLRPTERRDNVYTLMGWAAGFDPVEAAKDRQAVVDFVHNVTDRKDLKIGEFVWVSDWRPNIRMVDRFGEGRVFLTGDAAHVHSPTGGQGANSSIQDSFNLGWKLALVSKGLSPLSLLSTYTEERLPVIAEMLEVTTNLLNRTMTGAHSDATWQRGGALLQLGVNYRWSSAVLDERQKEKEEASGHAYGGAAPGQVEALRAGDRAPDAPGLVPRSAAAYPTSLFQVFKPTFHTALIFARDPAKAAGVGRFLKKYPAKSIHSVAVAPGNWGFGPHVTFEEVDAAFLDWDGYAYKHYGVNSDDDGLTIVVVRPDGVVGGIVFGEEGLERYFSKIFA